MCQGARGRIHRAAEAVCERPNHARPQQTVYLLHIYTPDVLIVNRVSVKLLTVMLTWYGLCQPRQTDLMSPDF